MLSSFRISRNSGVHVFRFTEIPGFGVSGLSAVLVLWISENGASCFSGHLGFRVSGCVSLEVSSFRDFRCSLFSFVQFPLCLGQARPLTLIFRVERHGSSSQHPGHTKRDS